MPQKDNGCVVSDDGGIRPSMNIIRNHFIVTFFLVVFDFILSLWPLYILYYGFKGIYGKPSKQEETWYFSQFGRNMQKKGKDHGNL